MQSHVIQNNTGWGRERGEGRRIGKRQLIVSCYKNKIRNLSINESLERNGG